MTKFKDKMNSYKKHPGSFLLFLLVEMCIRDRDKTAIWELAPLNTSPKVILASLFFRSSQEVIGSETLLVFTREMCIRDRHQAGCGFI